MNTSYEKIEIVSVMRDVLEETEKWLVRAGKRGSEAFVLWAGIFKVEKEFCVDTPIFPKQVGIFSEGGVGVYVEGKELYVVNKWLYENNKKLLGQVHSHPTHAFHSDTDDTFPLVTACGQFSIVVPFFGTTNFDDLSQCAVFRLNRSGIWNELSRTETNKIFKVI